MAKLSHISAIYNSCVCKAALYLKFDDEKELCNKMLYGTYLWWYKRLFLEEASASPPSKEHTHPKKVTLSFLAFGPDWIRNEGVGWGETRERVKIGDSRDCCKIRSALDEADYWTRDATWSSREPYSTIDARPATS